MIHSIGHSKHLALTSHSNNSLQLIRHTNTRVVGPHRKIHRAAMTGVQVSGIDHIVLKVRDPEASVTWYAAKLGLQPVRLDEYKVRVSPTFLIDFFPKTKQVTSTSEDTTSSSAAPAAPAAAAAPAGAAANVDHFCLVVQGNSIEGVKQQLEEAGVAAEKQFDGVVVKRFGAQGNASSIYIKDPYDNVVELRTYAGQQ